LELIVHQLSPTTGTRLERDLETMKDKDREKETERERGRERGTMNGMGDREGKVHTDTR
jgi:hypothetical protein